MGIMHYPKLKEKGLTPLKVLRMLGLRGWTRDRKRDEVERLVKELMEGEKGKRMKKRQWSGSK
ncbi:hypothetical protein CDL15_Pgr028827 [Punica granatum]|nr:hypothetical protein CDL15_Pgr028827 [Punica granatum]